jgi:hypothetical protein
VFCANSSTDHLYEDHCGYHCSSLESCKKNLISVHVRKKPLSKNEAFGYLTHKRRHSVFLSSICHELSRDSQDNNWRSKFEITGAISIQRSFHGLKETELYQREFPDPCYNCLIPVTISLRFNDKKFDEKAIAGAAIFAGSYHENYGALSNLAGTDPIRIVVELDISNEIKEIFITEIKLGLLEKIIHDSTTQNHLTTQELFVSGKKNSDTAFFDNLKYLDFLKRNGLMGLNYSLKTKLNFEFKNPVDPINDQQSLSRDFTPEFLNITEWALDSKI